MSLEQIPKETRWALLQLGYNPANPADVKRYKNKQPPSRELATHVAEVGVYKSLGEATISDNQSYAQIDRAFGASAGKFDESLLKDPQPIVGRSQDYTESDYEQGYDTTEENLYDNESEDPRGKINRMMNNTQAIGGNHKLDSLHETIKTRQVPEKRQLITEGAAAREVGYKKGVGYINAFIKLLKQPNIETRKIFFKKTQECEFMQESIHPKIIKYYQAGITQAEKEYAQQIRLLVEQSQRSKSSLKG
jgi:hypothetical protein